MIAAREESPRWYRLTPDRCVLGMLLIEGLLWLSERLRWFPFNQHKGWTVLIAVASVAAALLAMSLWFLAAFVFRRRFQFSIRALLLLMVVVAAGCGWLATDIKQARKQQAVVEGIHKARGTCFYDYELDPDGTEAPDAGPSGPDWLRKLLGKDFLASVTKVNLSTSEAIDAGLRLLQGLPQLTSLELDLSGVSDADLQHLEGLTQLRDLQLDQTNVSDAGLEHLKRLTQLHSLSLNGTKIGDAGLEHLKGLTRLEHLSLDLTKISDAGLEHLKGLTELQGLQITNTKVGDAGLEYLRGLPQLRESLPRSHQSRRRRAGTPQRDDPTRKPEPG